LQQNRPNPFNPTTEINYKLNADSTVSLQIFDVQGRLVKKLVDKQQPGGNYHVVWNGKNSDNNTVASGIYFYRLTIDHHSQTKRMVLAK